ncbi:MAG: hypothetical protein J5736_03825 [Bacilli bacterium]|nr:hypothetical protein [Bacilli bacterium]
MGGRGSGRIKGNDRIRLSIYVPPEIDQKIREEKGISKVVESKIINFLENGVKGKIRKVKKGEKGNFKKLTFYLDERFYSEALEKKLPNETVSEFFYKVLNG